MTVIGARGKHVTQVGLVWALPWDWSMDLVGENIFSTEVCREGRSHMEKVEGLSREGESKAATWDEEKGRNNSFSFKPLNYPSIQTNAENQWISPFSTKQVHTGCQLFTFKRTTIHSGMPDFCTSLGWRRGRHLTPFARGGTGNSEHCLNLMHKLSRGAGISQSIHSSINHLVCIKLLF